MFNNHFVNSSCIEYFCTFGHSSYISVCNQCKLRVVFVKETILPVVSLHVEASIIFDIEGLG